jgi:hypothetical protein
MIPGAIVLDEADQTFTLNNIWGDRVQFELADATVIFAALEAALRMHEVNNCLGAR